MSEDVRLALVARGRRHRVLGLEVHVDLLPLEQEIVQHVWVVPDLAANSEGLQRIGDTSEQDKKLRRCLIS